MGDRNRGGQAMGYPLDRAYFRVVITDKRGNRAMTRGYFLDEIDG